MFQLLLFLFILLVVIAFVFLNLIISFVRALFGGRSSSYTRNRGYTDNGNHTYGHRSAGGGGSSNGNASQAQSKASAGKRSKVFAEDEGEYVDFEEVND